MLCATLRVFFADQEQIVDNSSNRIRCTVNPPLNPFHLAYLFQTSFRRRGGGLIETGRVSVREGLLNLVKMVVSALYKELECKVEKLNIE